MKSKRIILVRHADYESDGTKDPSLSRVGENRASELGTKIANKIADSSVSILSSSAKRTQETAGVIQRVLPGSSLQVYEELCKHAPHSIDITWLNEVIEACDSGVIIVVGHVYLVWDYTRKSHPEYNKNPNYADGILIQDGVILDL